MNLKIFVYLYKMSIMLSLSFYIKQFAKWFCMYLMKGIKTTQLDTTLLRSK